ncbi:hypothetical protein [Nonomuraea sp. NPDC050783]|uniref:hypothetical protein n=1 Tax=Nonomuraea sp. NPDC050783 TaxID=3154634 RepID=UPI003467E022
MTSVTNGTVILPGQVATRRWRRGAPARPPYVVITPYVPMAAIGPLPIASDPVHTVADSRAPTPACSRRG